MYRNALVKSYAAPPVPGNPRETEAWGLTQAALRMREARETNDRDVMLAAVRINWQLWTIIQAELLAPECPVPPELRGNLLSLANFIDGHTMKFLSDPKADKLDVLITVNRELAGGLYQSLRANPPEPAGRETVAEAPAGAPPGPSTGTTDTSA